MGTDQPLVVELNSLITAGKKIRTSVLQPQATLISANSHVNLEQDPKLYKGPPPDQHLDYNFVGSWLEGQLSYT